ncbi:hypothetical protein SteCoe_27108 [Stentor coeruleus]|uniref:Uncharacterized protein n=1 Tax=Stentor coeruleus TaxID=5963 RepID=A0A1R2BBK4_9CILI|nr:hypothetical protein SteCoe_27108 [Stentor coeruleus]
MSREEIKQDPSEMLIRVINSYLNEIYQASPPNINWKSYDNPIHIDFDIKGGSKRDIKLDMAKNYLIIYTTNHILKLENHDDKDRVLFFVAHINEGLSLTGLDFNVDSGEFRYKSGQSFPRNSDFSRVLRYFNELHDAHFDKLQESIINFLHQRTLDPLESAKAFLNKIKS